MKNFIVLLFVSFCSALSIGDQLHGEYTVYDAYPITSQDAVNAGWAQNTTAGCVPTLGNEFVLNGGGTRHPLSLFFTPQGQLSGMKITIDGEVPLKLVKMGWWQVQGSTPFLTLGFRGSKACGQTTFPTKIGEEIMVNPDSGFNYALPLTEKERIAARFVNGSCFATMGTHAFLDVATPGHMSWQAENLAPVVPMYNNGEINAIFFTVPNVQASLFSSNMWDPVPLINMLMCKNWCDSSCTFNGTSIWSTMHIYFRDYKTVTCDNGCTISCCPDK